MLWFYPNLSTIEQLLGTALWFYPFTPSLTSQARLSSNLNLIYIKLYSCTIAERLEYMEKYHTGSVAHSGWQSGCQTACGALTLPLAVALPVAAVG